MMILTKLEHLKTKAQDRRWILLILFSVFILIPFQKRFHGAVDSFSRTLTLPNLLLPDFFSTKIHLFPTDFLIVALVIAIFWLYRVSFEDFFWNGSSKYLTLLILACLFSIRFSITSTYALGYWRLFGFFAPVLLFHSIRCLGQKIDLVPFVKRVAWSLVILGGVQCVISIFQYFMQSSLGLGALGEQGIKHFPFPNPGHRWLLDRLFHQGLEGKYLLRASGTFSHPNILGGFIFSATMASFFLYAQELKKRKKIVLLVGILLQLFTLCIAFSRSAMIALGMATFIWCTLQLWNARKGNMGEMLKRTRPALGALLLGGILCVGLFYSQLMARKEFFGHADSERVQYIKVALEMVKEHPLLGVGYNNFQLYASELQNNPTGPLLFSRVHNIYLLFAAETGLIGGGLFLLFLLVLLRSNLKKATQNQSGFFLFSLLAGFLFIGACDFYLVDSPQGSLLFFGIAGLLESVQGKLDVILYRK